MSEKTVAQKLFIKPGKRVMPVCMPENGQSLLGDLPEEVSLLDESTPADHLLAGDVIILFAKNRAVLEANLPNLRSSLTPGGMLWVAYYKGTSRKQTDSHRDTINAYAQTLGMTGVAIISMDEDWAALRLKLI